MKLGLLTLLLSFPSLLLAQDNKEDSVYPNTFTSGSAKVSKLTTKLKGIMIGQSL